MHWETPIVTTLSKLWCLTDRTTKANWFVKLMTVILNDCSAFQKHPCTYWLIKQEERHMLQEELEYLRQLQKGKPVNRGIYRKFGRTYWCWEMWHGFISVDQTTGWTVAELESCLWSARCCSKGLWSVLWTLPMWEDTVERPYGTRPRSYYHVSDGKEEPPFVSMICWISLVLYTAL